MKTAIKLVILTVVAMMIASCSGRQLEIVNESTVKENQAVNGTLYDTSVIFMYDGENIGRFYLGDIPVGKSVKVEIPTKADKVALSWCFFPDKQDKEDKEKNMEDETYEVLKQISTVMLPNFTYLEEKGNTRIMVDDKTYTKMVQ